jgi:undecaprenyl-diphosphatase
LPFRRAPRRDDFVGAILLAFLPAAVIGALAHGFIKTVLFESTALICWVLIGGGIILLIIDRMPLQPKYTNVMDYPLSLAFKIGLASAWR